MDYLPQILGLSGVAKTNIILSVVVILLLIISAFFSSAETAFSSASVLRIKTNAENKEKGAVKAAYICDHFNKFLATVLVGNNLVNIANTTICAYIFTTSIINPTIANLVNTVVMTLVILIFGEITPKAMAKQNPEKVAQRYSGVMFFLMKVLYPICFPFLKLQEALIKKDKKHHEANPTVTEDELDNIIDTMEEEGVIESQDADLIQGVLDLGDRCAYDIMTPRVDITAINKEDSIEKVKEIFLDTQYSRLPVYDEDIDNIVGILNQKDFFSQLLTNKTPEIHKLMQEPLFISKTLKVDDIIREMQKQKKHMAVVLDEYGGTSGIVTMENAIEEIVGEIYDEHDDDEIIEPIKKTGENTYILDADVEIADLFDKLEIEHLPDSQYSNLGGWLYEMAEDLPVENDKIEYVAIDDVINEDAQVVQRKVKLVFTITKVEDNRVKQASLLVKPEYDEDTQKDIKKAIDQSNKKDEE